jgi:hypothetical protein
MARYQHILSKLDPNDADEEAGYGAEWLPSDDEAVDMNIETPKIKGGTGPFVGTFADAAAVVA